VGTHIPLFSGFLCAYGAAGRGQETIERLKAITQVVVPTATHWRNAEHRKLYLSGLRLAAGETT
jgi:hypothetical protein